MITAICKTLDVFFFLCAPANNIKHLFLVKCGSGDVFISAPQLTMLLTRGLRPLIKNYVIAIYTVVDPWEICGNNKLLLSF